MPLPIRLTIAKTKKTKNKIFAMPTALVATKPNPNTPATMAIKKKIAAQYNMGHLHPPS